MINYRVRLHEKGFTLVELMIVVLLVGILITLSVAVYTHFLKKARTVEAQQLLTNLAKQQTSHYVEFGRYTNNPVAIGFSVVGKRRYTISIVAEGETPQTYLATASANIDDDPEPDEWTIDQTETLVHTKID